MKYGELIRTLKRHGWFVIRQKGSHLIMGHPAKTRKIVVPNHGSREIGKGIEISIKKAAGLF